MLGDEDVLVEEHNHLYMTSAVCQSEIANVYEVKQDDFLKELKKQVTWAEIYK